MASRFPSIEEFDEGQVPPISTEFDMNIPERERLALGDDADLFATTDDADLLKGPAVTQKPFQQDTFEGTYFPSLDEPTVGPGGVITGTSEPYLPSQNTYSGMPIQIEEEPEVIKSVMPNLAYYITGPLTNMGHVRLWRERQALEIQHRDELSESRKRETIEKAQRAVDDFYENYNAKRDKAIELTRTEAQEFLDSRENTTSGGTAWERIAKLVDLTEKGARSGKSDKTRFREMLLSLKKDQTAPGASGF